MIFFVRKFKKRNVKITKIMLDDAKKMIRLMGVPVVEAKGEAEAQCVDLVKKGHAYAVASEDMDCLTFGANVQLRSNKFTPIIHDEFHFLCSLLIMKTLREKRTRSQKSSLKMFWRTWS